MEYAFIYRFIPFEYNMYINIIYTIRLLHLHIPYRTISAQAFVRLLCRLRCICRQRHERSQKTRVVRTGRRICGRL